MAGFVLGRRSHENLNGVSSPLVAVVERAIQITRVDFTVTEGRRSAARQRRLVEIGASKTMNSRHLTGDAVDLAAWVDGEVSWHWPLYFDIAEAMRQAAQELDEPVEWGGCWTVINNELDLGKAQADYVARKRARNERPFLDGPHYQLPW